MSVGSTDPGGFATPLASPTNLNPFARMGVIGFVILAIPTVQAVEVSLVGRLFLPEILLTALLPFLIMWRGHALLKPLPLTFLILGLFWLLNQVATDLARDVPTADYLRGWARIAFTGFCFASLYLLINNRPDRILLYFLGVVIGLTLDYYLAPSSYAARHPWKFGLGPPVTLAVFFLAFYANKLAFFGKRVWPAGLAALIGLINLYMGFRSLGGICLMVSMYLAIWILCAGSVRRLAVAKLRTVVLFSVIILTFGITLVEGFSYFAKSGYLGADAQRKFQFQGSGEFGLLLGGRQEIFTSARAIQKSPVFGHGSWAKDPELTYHYAIFELRRQFGYGTYEHVGSELLPTHSHVFGAWVEAGILGAVFWFWVLTLVLRSLVLLYRQDDPLVPILAFIAFILLWDIVFSPYGAERRFTTTFFIVALMTVIERAKATTAAKTRVA